MARLVSRSGIAIFPNEKGSGMRSRRGDHSILPEGIMPGDLITDGLGSTETTPDGIEISSIELERIIERGISGKKHATCSIHLGDNKYYLPTGEEIQQIFSATSRQRRTWIEERYDCDDFAYVMKAFASTVAYINERLSFGMCCGIVWGEFDWLSGFHACNWVVTSDKRFHLIEPQDDSLHPASACKGNVTFVAV